MIRLSLIPLTRSGRDPLIADKLKHHDPSFGYNNASGYIEEDSVQALEQVVSEEFGVGGQRPRVLATAGRRRASARPAIYVEYKQALTQGAQLYSKWFVHAVESGDLREAKLQNTVKDFFSAYPSQRSK